MLISSPSSKSVTDVASAIAMLSLAIQLHHAKTASEHLNGRSITLDGDMYLLTPIPDRDPGQLAVSVQFPDGVTVSKVFDALGYPFEHAGLEKALAIIAGANQAMSDARAKATELLEEFVAEVAQAA